MSPRSRTGLPRRTGPLPWVSRTRPEPQVQPQPIAGNPHENPTALPLSPPAVSVQAVDPRPVASDWRMQGTFVDIPLSRPDRHVIDIDPPGSSQESAQPSSSHIGRSVVDQLAQTTQYVRPLQQVLGSLRQEPPPVPPGELAARLNQRFNLHILREVNRPLDMLHMVECVKERERQLALPASEQNWDKAVQLYKKACKLDMAQVEKGWRAAGAIYPLATVPSGFLVLLPGLATLKFSSLQPIAQASLNLGLQTGLSLVAPMLNAGFQNFFTNLQELKRVGGLSHRSPALAGASAPGFGKATENIEKALGEVDAALAALRTESAGPTEAEQAVKAQQQLTSALQAYERRVDVNNLNYTAQFWQCTAKTARQVAYFLAPVLGNYCNVGGNGRYISYGVQVAATLGLWIAQQFAAPRDEKNRQDDTILATLKHTDVRKASAVEDKVAADDLTQEHVDARKFRDQWRGPDKVRLMAVNDILQTRIAGHLASAAKLVGLTPLEWGTLQSLEGRRHESPAPLTLHQRARLEDVRQQSHEHISRSNLLEWMDLEECARDPLSDQEGRQFSTLEKKFKTSTMSEHAWTRLQELAAKCDAEPDSLTWPEHEELAQLQERSTSSLTVAEHARLETLRIRHKFSPNATDAATRGMLEDKAMLSEAERAVLTRTRHAEGNESLPASANDFRDMGAIWRKLRDKLDDKELAAHGEALSRQSSGLTPAEKKQYIELHNKGRFNALDAPAQAQMGVLKQQVKELRLDKRMLIWDWSKLSDGTQSVVEGALSGASDLQQAWQTTKARLGQRQESTPELAQRYGSSFQMIFGGSTMPFVVGAGFQMASALGKRAAFEAVRVPVGLATLAIGIMGAWATGSLTNFKITERARLRTLSEEAPSTTQLLLSSIPRAMFSLPTEVAQLRRSAKVAASGKQWLAHQGDRLQLAVQRARQRTGAQQVPGSMPAAADRPEVVAPQGLFARPTPATAPDLTRPNNWFLALDGLLDATADIQRRARELMARAPQMATVHPLPI